MNLINQYRPWVYLTRKRTSRIAFLAGCAVAMINVLSLLPATSIAQPGPPVDQNKYRPDLMLFYLDSDADTWHDPGEVFDDASGGGYVSKNDNSCWMASASNMLMYAGHANPYGQPAPGAPGWLGNGGAPSPSVSSWGNVYSVGGGGSAMTWDDGGFQHWAIAHAGIACPPPAHALQEFTPGTWLIDPVTWCKQRIDMGFPVGLAVWWGSPPKGTLPGRVDLTKDFGYHAITLWDINETAKTVTITDSDDDFSGARQCSYTYTGSDWVIKNLYVGVDAHMNYAVSLCAGCPTLAEWAVIVLALALLAVGACCLLRRKEATPILPA